MKPLDTKGAEELKNDITIAKKVVKRNKPVIFIVDGELGMGKTSTAVALAKEIQPTFDELKQMGRGGDQFTKAWEYTENLKVGRGVKACIFDEAQDIDKASHASKRNRAIRMFFDTFRDANTILILCLPNFYRLESNIFHNGSVRALFHIFEQHKTFLKGMAYEPDTVRVRMLDYLYRNRNEPNKARVGVYKHRWRNYYFTVLKHDKDKQLKIDRASSRGKKKLRKKALNSIK